MNDNRWMCLDCRYIGPLTKHGDCPTCRSQAVVWAEPARSQQQNEVKELERIFRI